MTWFSLLRKKVGAVTTGSSPGMFNVSYSQRRDDDDEEDEEES